MWDFISSFIANSYKCFVSVIHPVFGISCAAVLLGFAGVKVGIWFLHSFIGGSSASNADVSENHPIVRRK